MDACPAGFTATTQDRVCIENAHIDGANKCEAKGWTTRLEIAGFAFSLCNIKNKDPTSTQDFCILGINCADRFGPDLDFPQRPADDPATAEDESDPRYVYNCDTGGTTGHLPATFADGRTMCECPAAATENADGVCVCPAQTVLLGEACLADTPENRCKAAGWTVSTDNQCVVPITSPDGGNADGCFLAGNGSPQCADVFGPDLSFPDPSTDSAARFVYDCGLDMIPPRANTDGETECAPDPQACGFSDVASTFSGQDSAQQISMQFDVCAAKGWQAKKHPSFESVLKSCYCDINVRDASAAVACPYSHSSSRFGNVSGNTFLRHHFGPALQYLPQWTAENADTCFVSHCPDGMEPTEFNTNGATECLAPSGTVCGELSPAKRFDGSACVEDCAMAATLNEAANVCECQAPNVGTGSDCRAPSPQVCAGLTPAKFFNETACVDFVLCAAPATLNEATNVCACNSPNVGTGSDCRAPSIQACAGLTPAKHFDGATCVNLVFCDAPLVPDIATNTCVSGDINLRLRIFLEGPLR